MKSVLLTACVVLFSCVICSGQVVTKPKSTAMSADSQSARSSPAYSEVLLRRTEIESELEGLLLDFTEDYPKVKAARFSLAQLQKQAEMLIAVKPVDQSRLTLALGKLLVRKTELETDLWTLQQGFADGHPDVKRAKKKVEIFDRAIKEILG